jgi:hypothetical protein
VKSLRVCAALQGKCNGNKKATNEPHLLCDEKIFFCITLHQATLQERRSKRLRETTTTPPTAKKAKTTTTTKKAKGMSRDVLSEFKL